MAYGAIATPKMTQDLPVFSYPLPGGIEVTTHAVHGEASEEIMRYLHGVFEEELEGQWVIPTSEVNPWG